MNNKLSINPKHDYSPHLDFLLRLTTPFGIMQHSINDIPDPWHGYATDDNARALMAVNILLKEEQEKYEGLENLKFIFIKFLRSQQTPEGKFYCYLDSDYKKSNLGTGDWYGRSMMALAHTIFLNDNEISVYPIFEKSSNLLFSESFSLKTICFLIFSIFYLKDANERFNFIDQKDLRMFENQLMIWKDELIEKYNSNSNKGWIWPEKVMTYDNGKVIQAFLLLGILTKDEKIKRIGFDMLDFYIQITFKKDYFQFPGNNGFWTKENKPLFDEQPIEVYSMISALVSGYLISQKAHYLDRADICYKWFWGGNRLGINMVDAKTGGVYDGLQKNSFNKNQGAEGYLSLLLAYLAITKKVHI